MWDDLTQSWWQQLTGRGIVGTFTSTKLAIIPAQVVSCAAFVEQYPNGDVLSANGRDYDYNPYAGYDSNSGSFLFRGQIDDHLVATERMSAGIVGGEPSAYPFPVLAEQIVINDTVGSVDVVAIWQPGETSALDQSTISESRDVGMARLFSRNLDGQVLTSRVDKDGTIRDGQAASVWTIFGTATEGELAGSQLDQEWAFTHFWLAWAAFQPDTIVYGETPN